MSYIQIRKWNFSSANFIKEQIWLHFCFEIRGSETKLHTEHFVIRDPKNTNHTN
jgi:hypothetical protein